MLYELRTRLARDDLYILTGGFGLVARRYISRNAESADAVSCLVSLEHRAASS